MSRDFVVPEMDPSDPDYNFEPRSEDWVIAKAKTPGGIGWMERVGVIDEEAAAALRKRFPEAR